MSIPNSLGIRRFSAPLSDSIGVSKTQLLRPSPSQDPSFPFWETISTWDLGSAIFGPVVKKNGLIKAWANFWISCKRRHPEIQCFRTTYFLVVSWNGGTPSHHPFIDRIFMDFPWNKPSVDMVCPWLWNPHLKDLYLLGYFRNHRDPPTMATPFRKKRIGLDFHGWSIHIPFTGAKKNTSRGTKKTSMIH